MSMDGTPQPPQSNNSGANNPQGNHSGGYQPTNPGGYPQGNPNAGEQPTQQIPTQPQPNLAGQPSSPYAPYSQNNQSGGYSQNYPGGYPQNYAGGYSQNYPGGGYPLNMAVGSYQAVPSKKKGLAIAAMVLGIIALLFSWVPIVNWFMLALAVAGLVLGIIAMVLAKRNPQTTGGFGMALSGVITSVLAIIVVIVFHVWIANAIDEKAEESHRDPSATVSVSPSPDQTDDADDEETVEPDDEETPERDDEDASDLDDDADSLSDSDFDSALGDRNVDIQLGSFQAAGPDQSGKPTGMLTFTVTNNGEETYQLMLLTYTVTQGGTMLEPFPYYNFGEEPEGYDSFSSWESVEPGDTATVTVAFTLVDDSSPVDVEVYDIFETDNSKIATDTFNLQ